MKKKTILVLHSLLSEEMEQLDQHFNIIRLGKEPNPEAAIRENKDNIVGIVSNHTTPVKQPLIEALPNLEIIANFAVGIDNIDTELAKNRNIIVTNTPNVLSDETADTAMALLLATARRVVEADMFVRVGRWQQGHAFPLGTSIKHKTAGIVGLGRIGKSIARKARAFDMNVLYTGRTEQSDQPYEYVDNLFDLAEQSDVLILACPGGEETHNIINLEILQTLGSAGILINVARGSVVNEEDLLIALRNKNIAGAGLDVYAKEPHVPEEMLKMDNVVLLPHIGSATTETRGKMGQLVVGNLIAHFNGEPLLSEYKA